MPIGQSKFKTLIYGVIDLASSLRDLLSGVGGLLSAGRSSGSSKSTALGPCSLLLVWLYHK